MANDSHPQEEGLRATISAWKRGEPEAFGEIYRCFFMSVREIVHLRLGGSLRISSDSADIVQDVFLGLLRVPPPDGVARASELRAYLTEAVLNRLRDVQRHEHRGKRDRDREVSASERSQVLARVAQPEPTPSEISMGREKYCRFLQELGRLQQRERDAIVCTRIEGLSSEEAAAHMGFENPGAFRAYLSRALSKLSLAMERRA